ASDPGWVCTCVFAPGGPLARLMRSRYSGAATGGTGPISTTLVAPGDDPPFAPRVNNQALPATSAASPVGPAAACASASVGKVSTRQNNDPSGSRVTFFSTTGLTCNAGSAALERGSNSAVIAITTHTGSTHDMIELE